MLSHSLRIREARFAYLFGPPRHLKRDEGAQIHARICDGLGLDDIGFSYSRADQPTGLEQSGFAVRMQRSEGRGGLRIEISSKAKGQPIRLLMVYEWPNGLEYAKQAFDAVAKAALDDARPPWAKVLAECRLMAHCEAPDQDAVGFLSSNLANVPRKWREDWGAGFSFAGLRFEVEASPTAESIAHPKRALSLEVLRSDPKNFFVELVSTWPQIFILRSEDIQKVRPFSDPPSTYIADAYSFLTKRLDGIAAAESET